MSTPPSNVFLLGGSRGVGYQTALRLLKNGYTVTFLLRSAKVFDSDEEIRGYVEAGKARIAEGDALNAEDMRYGWDVATVGGVSLVDYVFSSVGGAGHFSIFRWGLYIWPPNLCTLVTLNLFSTIPEEQRAPDRQPRFIIMTDIGCRHSAFKKLPIWLKFMHGLIIHSPHADKLGVERVTAHVAGWEWKEPEPRHDILDPKVLAEEKWPGLPTRGELKHVVVVRPGILTDGECEGDKAGVVAPYRVTDGDFSDPYTISRRDVAHFVAEEVVPNWDRWEGKGASIVY